MANYKVSYFCSFIKVNKVKYTSKQKEIVKFYVVVSLVCIISFEHYLECF